MLVAAALIFAIEFDAHAAERFANLALACVHKEYPNKISHSLNSDADVAPPRKLTPAFYGCYDWHSSVHGHWLLARLARAFPDASFTPRAREALKESLTAESIAQEAAYLRAEGRSSFERPYGLAWLLQLGAELRESDPELSANLHPLEQAVTEPSDPRLAHLDGLNLSRAWMLEGIASGLPKGDPRIAAITAAANAHRHAGLASVTGAHYEGGHWLGSFAVYLTTGRGLQASRSFAPRSGEKVPEGRMRGR